MESDGFRKQKPGFATKAIQAGQEPENWKSQCLVPGIVTSTTYKQSSPGVHQGYEYGRSGNPTRTCLQECLAALDGGKYAICFSSGLGVTTAIVSLLNSGDHIISAEDIYGGTNRLFRRVVGRQGIQTTFLNMSDAHKVEAAIKPNTKLMWLETPSNPLLKVVNIEALAKIGKEHNIFVVVDNTFLTPYLQRPLDFGVDVVVYSLSKYMNGHSDVIMGAAVCNDQKLAERLSFIQSSMGIVPSPFDCYLVNRGLKTLALRMERHKSSSLTVARWLEKHPHVVKVLHPGLPSHPNHELAKKQTYGHSGMISFYHKGGLRESKKFLSVLKVFTLAESLGGYASLAEIPSMMELGTMTPEHKSELGITDSLIRLSIGLEDHGDLVADLAEAFKLTF